MRSRHRSTPCLPCAPGPTSIITSYGSKTDWLCQRLSSRDLCLHPIMFELREGSIPVYLPMTWTHVVRCLHSQHSIYVLATTPSLSELRREHAVRPTERLPSLSKVTLGCEHDRNQLTYAEPDLANTCSKGSRRNQLHICPRNIDIGKSRLSLILGISHNP